MSRSRSALAAILGALLVVAMTAPASAGEYDPDPLSLLPGRGFTETVGLGADTAQVWICNSAFAHQNVQTFTVDDIVAWATTDVAPYFSTVSNGRYTISFIAGGEFTLSTGYGGDAVSRCIDEAEQRTTGAPNAMVMTREAAGGGLGGAGTVYLGSNGYTGADLGTAASTSGRGFAVRGGSYLLPHTVAHEVGHTLHWPHSGSGTEGATTPYDNQLDIMSGGGYVPLSPTWTNSCSFGFSTKGPCEISHTMGINRYAAGWIDVDRIVPVARDGVSTELVGPEIHTGPAFAIVPTADPLVYLTVEARPATGYDAILPISSVVVNRVDLTYACSLGDPFCVGAQRRQSPAVSAVDTDAHAIEVGESLVVEGVTISVTAATSSGFDVSFSGQPAGCAMGPNPFYDLPTTSYAYDSVGCIRVLGITTGTTASTYSPEALVSREQMAAFLGRLWRALGRSCSTASTPFTDVSATSFAFDDIACIYALGVTNGTTGTTYSPADDVTRRQMASFLARLWRALGNTCSTAATPFTDLAGLSAETIADIECIYALRITNGKTPTTYAPGDPVDREQMAAFIDRFWTAAT